MDLETSARGARDRLLLVLVFVVKRGFASNQAFRSFAGHTAVQNLGFLKRNLEENARNGAQIEEKRRKERAAKGRTT